MNKSMSMYATKEDYWKAVAEEYKKDAERYRWLRDVGDTTFKALSERPGVCCRQQVDAAIDAAMKE